MITGLLETGAMMVLVFLVSLLSCSHSSTCSLTSGVAGLIFTIKWYHCITYYVLNCVFVKAYLIIRGQRYYNQVKKLAKPLT